MTEMIERVTEALWDNRYGPGKYAEAVVIAKDIPDGTTADQLLGMRNAAIVALTAMKEPTDRMVGGGEALSDFLLPDVMGNTTEERRKEMKVAYQYMINIALGEV